MRIPTITNFFDVKKYDNIVKTTKDDSLTFSAVDINKLKKMPIEKKLSHMFITMNDSDLILLGKNINEAKDALSAVITNFTNVIKRILFVKHGGIATTMAFFKKDEINPVEMVNIGEKPVLLCKDDRVDIFNKYDHGYVDNKDVILLNDNISIPIDSLVTYDGKIEDEKDFDILSNAASYANKSVDFYEKRQNVIEQLNTELLNNLKVSEEQDNKVKKNKKLTFSDVGGLEHVIDKLKKGIIYPIEFPYAYENEKVNKGFILYGPPGTGKTLLARALANEVSANYVKLNGLEMESKWVGESEQNWRELFNQAEMSGPTIMFIDEFDAVGRKRGSGDIHGDKVVNQLLTLIDDLEKENKDLYLIVATNKLEILDDAILRSGRFGEKIEVNVADRVGKEQIFDIHIKNKNIDENFNKKQFLDDCHEKNFTGADLSFLVTKARENAWQRCGIYEKMANKSLTKADILNLKITQEDFDKALIDVAKSCKNNARKPVGFIK